MRDKGSVGEWLEQKYVSWMKDQGAFKKQHEFAAYLGIEPTLLSHYMNGRKKPAGENIELIAEKLGPEIYNLVEKANPNPIIRAINEILAILPEEDNREILEALRKRKAGTQKSENGNAQGNHLRA
jgi:transcriptional regulator with XRE-family HTH domain